MLYRSSIIAAGLMASLGSAIEPVHCDGDTAPDWDACETMFNWLQGHSTTYITNLYPLCSIIPVDNGADPDNLNCRVSVCPDSDSTLMLGADARNAYNTIRVDCADTAGGDWRIVDDWYMRTYAREKAFTVPEAFAKFSAPQKRLLLPCDACRHANFDLPISAEISNNPDYEISKKTSTNATIPDERDHARSFPKRQDDGDDDFTLVVKKDSAERGGIAVTGRLPAGSKYTVTHEDSHTTGITTSASAEAGFFDIFSVSVSLEVSQEFTTTNSYGVDVNVDCESGQYGEVYWYPLYTIYSGFYTPSRTNADWYIPEDSRKSGSNYRVRCLE
ncbi:uncharacterized protein LTR77_008972 [Saxophila tyrrhenica]|uniref:Uncharacterized protein n=1 Tax=Saxophila tyrrhenica TaxID=1690608 RepID=A0AAV9NZB5_9PEZI|nr:hypothetical protein LTR77_008972 [Saxophila tyrrhenica]